MLLCLPLPQQINKPCSSSDRGDGRKAGEDEEQADAKLNISSPSPRSTAWGLDMADSGTGRALYTPTSHSVGTLSGVAHRYLLGKATSSARFASDCV